jgi:prophage DNA circulation protein
MGRKVVRVVGEFSRRETNDRGGMTTFEIPFQELHETELVVSPGPSLGDASNGVRDAAGADAEARVATTGWPEYVRQATSDALSSVAVVLKGLRFVQAEQAEVAAFTNQVTSLIDNLSSLAVAPAQLAAQVFESVEKIGQVGMNAVDAFYVYRVLFELAPKKIGGSSAAAMAADLNAQLCIDLARAAALYSAAKEAAAATWPSAAAVESARLDLEGQIQDLQSRASDDVYQSLEDLRVAIDAALPAAIERAQEQRAVTLARDTPAVVLASRFHDDVSRTDEIVRRNGIRHPLFVPAARDILISIDG